MSEAVNRILDFFTKDWLLKVLALILGAVTFYAIRGAISFEITLDVPLTAQVEHGVAILEQDPLSIKTTLRGSREDLRRLDQSAVRGVIAIAPNDSDGSALIEIGPQHIEGAAGVRVVQIRPQFARLTFDRETEVRMPVARPKTIGRPLIGRAEIEYEPRFVTVRGPSRRMTAREVFTEPIDVDGKIESFSRQIRVLPGDMANVRIVPPEITAKVSIVTETASRSWSNIVVHVLAKGDRATPVTIDPDKVKVTLHGRSEALDGLSESVIRVFLDAAGPPPPATSELPVNVYLPPGLDVTAEVDPASVRVIASP